MESIVWKINGVGAAESEDIGFSKGIDRRREA
jgi:hypothetical protein